MAKPNKYSPVDAKEIVSELKAFIKCPMDPALRKLLKLTIAAIEALTEPEEIVETPSLPERIKDAE